jgi:hypothetical protein
MRHRPGRLRDDARIPGIGLRLTLVKVRETGHREAWETADQDPLGLRDRDRQSDPTSHSLFVELMATNGTGPQLMVCNSM